MYYLNLVFLLQNYAHDISDPLPNIFASSL